MPLHPEAVNKNPAACEKMPTEGVLAPFASLASFAVCSLEPRVMMGCARRLAASEWSR